MKDNGGQTKRLLLIAFGGLLLLLAFTGLNAFSMLQRIETRNEQIREDYIHRDQILERLRSDIYLSGTYVRDFLLEADDARSDLHRRELAGARRRIQANVASYQEIGREEEKPALARFTAGLAAYFESLRPALEWNAAERHAFGYGFMRNSLLPRRMVMVRLADQISAVNQKQLETGSRQVAGLFASFRRSLILLIVLTLGGGLVLAGGSIHRILRLERLSALRFREVEQARGALRDLSARLIEVQETERRVLSRELHDEVGQSLSALLIGIGNIAAMMHSDNLEARAHLEELRHLAERSVSVVRDMSLLLRPSMLDDLGLTPALEWHAREVSRMANLAVHVDADSMPEDLPEEYKTCIYRVVQEALHNITRHAEAKSVLIKLAQQGDTLRLTVQDDGRGFVPERQKGVGLLGMEERVAHLKGSFRVQSHPGDGTTIAVELPVAPIYEQATA